MFTKKFLPSRFLLADRVLLVSAAVLPVVVHPSREKRIFVYSHHRRMTQDFHVLRCCECKIFQVHQVKKSNKWNCKVCGTKQSIKQVYGKGTGFQCRQHVQKLNALRGQQASCHDVKFTQLPSENSESTERNALNELVLQNCESPRSSKRSKWTQFLQDDSEHNGSTSDDLNNSPTILAVTPSEVANLSKSKYEKAMSHTSSSCPDAVTSQVGQKYFNTVIQDKTGKFSESFVTSNDHLNEMRLPMEQKNFNSDRKKCIKTSEQSESEEKGICKKTSGTLQMPNKELNKKKNYRGFQCILKASLKSGSSEPSAPIL